MDQPINFFGTKNTGSRWSGRCGCWGVVFVVFCAMFCCVLFLLCFVGFDILLYYYVVLYFIMLCCLSFFLSFFLSCCVLLCWCFVEIVVIVVIVVIVYGVCALLENTHRRTTLWDPTAHEK